MRSRKRLPAAWLAGLVGVSLGLLVRGAAATDPAGLWSGPVRHNGQEETFVLRLAEAGVDQFAVHVSLPAIDVWDLPLGVATLDGDTLRLRSWKVFLDRSSNKLTGVLPAALVPVHAIPFFLSRSDSLPQPPAQPPALPEVAPLWMHDTGSAIWAGLACSGDLVLAGNDAGIVVALGAKDGAERLRYATHGAIRARPHVEGASVWVHSDDGFLSKLRLRDGGEEWRVPIESSPVKRISPGSPGSRYDHQASSVCLAAGRLYVGSADGKLHALDADTGHTRWVFEAQDAIPSTPAHFDGAVFFGSFDGFVYAVGAARGDLLWRFDTGAPVASSAAVTERQVLMGSRSYDLFALDRATGVPGWKRYFWFSWIESSATVHADVAYIGSSDAQGLYALESAGGELLWRFDTGGSAWAQPAVNDTAVYVGSVGVADYIVAHQGSFVAVDRRTGRGIWAFPVARQGEEALWGFAASPVLGAGLVFAGDLHGRVYAFPQVERE